MGRWVLSLSAVVLLGLAATGVWHYGREFARDLALERATIAAAPVPADELTELSGQALAAQDRLPIQLLNTTIWNLTAVTLGLQTADDSEPLTLRLTERFGATPWAPGALTLRELDLGPAWNGRHVRYRVIAAEGFR